MTENLERLVVEAAVSAVRQIIGRLRSLWPKDYREGLSRTGYPEIYDTMETVLEFEIACQLQERLIPKDLEVSWEHRYAEDYPARVDLILAPPEADRDGPNRIAIELKWMAEGKGGMDGMASDALKLSWCEASARYVLGIGPRCGDTLERDLLDAIEDRIEWPNEESDLKQARSNLESCTLVESDSVDGIGIALFCIKQSNTL